MEGWKQRPVHYAYGQVFLWGLSKFQLRILLVLTLKKILRKKKLVLKHHMEIYLWREVAFSCVPVVFLFDCIGLLPVYQGFCDGLIDSLHILYWSNFEGMLNKSLENILIMVMMTSMSYKIKCPKWKKSHRRREITNSAAWPETHTFYKGEESSWAALRREQQNILPPFEKHNYTGQKVRDEAYQGTVQQLWLLIFTYKGWEGGSTRDRQQRPYVNSSMVLIRDRAACPFGSCHGGDLVQPRWDAPTASHTSWQHGASVSPGCPGTVLQCSNPAQAQHPSSRHLLVRIPLPLTFPIQNHTSMVQL